MKYCITLLLVMFSLSAMAFEKEDFYNKKYCAELGGEFGVYHSPEDTGLMKAFVDCETDTVVWEGEWSHKSYEGVGQALWYASFTGKIPGIMFYVKKDNQQKYIDRAILTFESLGIDYRIRVIDLTKSANVGLWQDSKGWASGAWDTIVDVVHESKEVIVITTSAAVGGAVALFTQAVIVEAVTSTAIYIVTDGLTTIVLPFSYATAPIWVPVVGGIAAAATAGGVIYCAYDNLTDTEGEVQGICDDLAKTTGAVWDKAKNTYTNLTDTK